MTGPAGKAVVDTDIDRSATGSSTPSVGGLPGRDVPSDADVALARKAFGFAQLGTVVTALSMGCVAVTLWHIDRVHLPAWLFISLMATMVVLPTIAGAIGIPRRLSIARAFAERADTEHEQIVIRLVFPIVILIYTQATAWVMGFPENIVNITVVVGVTVCVSWLFLIHIMLSPAVSLVRRGLGIFADLTPLTIALATGGEALSVLYPTYLWIVFGNGFRFGVGFLTLATGVSIVGFAIVIAVSDFWGAHTNVSSALLVAQIVLPIYVATLIRKLNRAIELAEAANRAKGRFLATMSHELRTPLTAIIGMGGLLKSTDISKDQRTMVATIDTSAQSLLTLINEILDFSKFEAGKLSLEVEPFDLHAVLGRVRTILHGQAEEKGLRLRISVDPRLPYRLRGDAQRLLQVLVNLIGNAIKFTDQGDVELAVHLHGAERGETLFRFEVSDTGIGIPVDKQAQIFEGFSQADDSIARRFGGTGLGLAISRQLVHGMGGEIGLQSAVGAGSVFTFKLPLEIDRDAEDKPIDPSALSVMLIGSEPDVVERLFLWLSGYSISPMIIEHVETLTTILSDPSAMAGTVVVVNDRAEDPLVAAFSDRICEVQRSHMPIVIEVCKSQAWTEPSAEWPVGVVLSSPDEEPALGNALHAAFAIMAPWTVDDEPLSGQASPTSGDIDAVDPELGRRGRRVLLAEDNSTNRMVISRMLEMAGYDVVAAATGDEALDVLADNDFDIALMDVNMPGTSGLDVVRLHRLSEIDGRHLPIVALTADATEDARRRCVDAGMDDFLTKPVEPNRLFAMIDGLTPDEAKPEDRSGEHEIVTPISCHPRYQTITEPVIDTGAIDALRNLDLDSGFVVDVLTEFLTDSRSIIEEIESAWQARDVSQFLDAAHSLRSSANHVGAKRVVGHLMSLRDIDREGLAANGEEAVRKLREEFAEVEVALNRELQGIKKAHHKP